MGDCAVILVFSKAEQYKFAASLAWLLNQIQGVMYFFMELLFTTNQGK